ncbi:hypothetical protein [Rickettsia sibirica]|nr:hypothetical protein [Rickettsia sibirica]
MLYIVIPYQKPTYEPMLSMPGLLDPKEDMALANLIKNDIKELVTIQNKQAKKAPSDEQVIEARYTLISPKVF